MTLELLKTVTPYLTFSLAIVVGLIGWFLKWMFHQNAREFKELKKKIREQGLEIRELERGRRADQKYVLEQCVNKEAFYLAVGKMEGLVSRIFDQLNELSKSVNQIIGAIHAKDPNTIK
ncbi:MAG: hypothetical protein ACE5E9_12600 [Nitrospinaceae bacterium]